ncbi:MAG: hypothetical protein CML68_01995 [Rhodobacteraceae bacterium]|nr:hypothetical protein [Paracoccaceae bacterium]
MHRPLILISALAALGPLGASAQEWSFSVAPYLWAAGQSGTVGVLPGVPPADIDLSFGDILEDLEASVMVVGQARLGRFAISADLQYIRTTTEGETPGPLYGATEVRTETFMATLTADYQVSAAPEGELWASAGLRYWDVDNRLTLAPGTLPGRVTDGTGRWVDPMIGLRGRYALTDAVELTGWAYLGGFGVGSDLTTDVFAGLAYGFSDRITGTLGWRHLTVDRTDGDFVYDVSQSGPVLGVAFHF